MLRRLRCCAVITPSAATRAYVVGKATAARTAFTPFHPKRGERLSAEDELPPPPAQTQTSLPGQATPPTKGEAFHAAPREAAAAPDRAEQYKASSAASRSEDGTGNWRSIARKEAISMHLPMGKPLPVDNGDQPLPPNDNFRSPHANDDPTKITPKLVSPFGLKSDLYNMRSDSTGVSSSSSTSSRFSPSDGSFKVTTSSTAPSTLKATGPKDAAAAFVELAESRAGAARVETKAKPQQSNSSNTGGEIFMWGIGGVLSLLSVIAVAKWDSERTPTTVISVDNVDGRITPALASRDTVAKREAEAPPRRDAHGHESSHHENAKPDAKEAKPEPEPRAKYATIEADIYSGLDNEYVDSGHIARGEEPLVLHDHVFAQYGVVTPSGVDVMLDRFVAPPLTESDVFVDIGSGIGNVVLQILVDTPCQRAVGVEMLPSRVKESKFAYLNGASKYPSLFEGKGATWLEGDVVALGEQLIAQQPSVIFTHSWMFDEDLMGKISVILKQMPKLRCVITSRPLNELFHGAESGWTVETTQLDADWNPKAPFYVYRRKPNDA